MPDLPEPYYSDEYCTIYHGDSRELLPLLDADVMVTDPPYGISYAGSMQPANPHLRAAFKTVQHSCTEWDATLEARDKVLAEWGDRPALVFGTWKTPKPAGTRQVVIWHKHKFGFGPANSDLPWANAHEELYVIGTGFTGKRGGSITSHQPPMPTGRNHPTEKPISLMRELISKCPPGTIIDPFMGSGSTLRAAKDLGRKCIGIELDERWCKVAVARLGQEVLEL